jgi:VWFA-related protein
MLRICFGTFLGIVFAASVTSTAQSQTQNGSRVLIPVVVTDYKDRYVSGLQKQDFRVLENGIEREVTDFAAMTRGPISVTFVMDLYGDKGNERTEEVASRLLDTAMIGDEFAIVDFKNGSVVASDFNQDIPEVKKAITAEHQERLSPFLDGLRVAIDRMKQAKNPRQFIVIVSDGNPHSRVYSRQEIDTLVGSTEAAIYSVSRNFAEVSDLTEGEAAARAGLDEIARRSGGRHFTIDSTTEVRDLGMRIGADFRTSYVLGFETQSSSAP